MKAWSLRRVSALASLFSFIPLGLSGTVMFFWPGHGGPRGELGGVATTVLGLGRNGWNEIHEVAAMVFLAGAIIHVALNWKPLKRHLGLRGKAA